MEEKLRECKMCDAIYIPELDLDNGGVYCDGCVRVGLEIEDLKKRLDQTTDLLKKAVEETLKEREIKKELLGELEGIELECMTSWCGVDPTIICSTCRAQALITKAKETK